MSGTELFIDEIDGRLHAAVVQHSKLINLYVDSTNNAQAWGSTYIGKITKVDKRLDAAIVDLGDGASGLLAAKHVYTPGLNLNVPRPGIEEMLQAGQMVVVQVKSEANRSAGHETRKLPRLTMKLCVIGQYLVYSPIGAQAAARKTENIKTAALTANLPGKGGWLTTSLAEKASQADIAAEADGLLREWQEIRTAMDAGEKTPRLVRQGPDALRRAMNDYSATRLDHIHAANKKIFDRMAGWCALFNPPLAESKRLRLFKGATPQEKLFEECDIYSELEYLQDNRVSLNNGGSIIIDEPHAFTVIDVNQGSAASASEANQDAAIEIARQVRLRNLSGAILIDFIGMSQKSERFQLVEKLSDLFASDGAGTQIHGFTRLGIIEMTRKRRTASYAEKMLVLLTK